MVKSVGEPRADSRRYTTTMRTILFGSRNVDEYRFVGDANVFGADIECVRPSVVLSIPAGSMRFHNPRYFTGAGGSHSSG
jgi:hypothetical protein